VFLRFVKLLPKPRFLQSFHHQNLGFPIVIESHVAHLYAKVVQMTDEFFHQVLTLSTEQVALLFQELMRTVNLIQWRSQEFLQGGA